MSKVFCKECKLIYDSKEVDKLHQLSNLKDHEYIKENNSLEILYYLCQQIKTFDEKIEESYKAESELLYLIQENRILINLFRGESQISIIHPDFELLNCISSKSDESACVMFRSKNIVYMTIKFEGKIKEITSPGKAKIEIKMPMWLIYSGSFNVESINNCLSQENDMIRLSVKYEQKDNKMYLYINQNDLGEQTYWIKSLDSCNFTIKGNFMTEPLQRRKNGNYYLYDIHSNKTISVNNNSLILIDDWERGCCLEVYKEKDEEEFKINNKYVNIKDNNVKLESIKKNDNEIRYVPGYSDIVQIVLYKDKKPMFLEVSGNNINLTEDPRNERTQFLIIPKLIKNDN